MKLVKTTLFAALLAALPFTAMGCLDSDGSASTSPSSTLNGLVNGTDGAVLEGAVVYLVPVTAIDMTEMTASAMRANTTADFDEPLEDTVRINGASFVSATTNVAGAFNMEVPDGDFYVYVEGPAGTLPGGSWCRTAVAASGLRGQDITIEMSGSPTAAATWTGPTACQSCHEDHVATAAGTAHSLGFSVVGSFGALQSGADHPEFWDGLDLFNYVASYDLGTPVYYYDFDGGRGMDKFKTALTDPTAYGGVVYAKIWLWQDTADDLYKLTIENVGNIADPNSPSTHIARLVYGGAVEKQRFMIEWPGRKGLYPLLQYQTFGEEAKYDRSRKVIRDYHLDYYWDRSGTDSDPSDDLITDPPTYKTMEANCIGCHATGYEMYLDGDTGEYLCDSVEDVNGLYDLDQDGTMNILNTTCETCHGPGSEHVAAAAAGIGGAFIVSPQNLSPSREIQLCKRCHDRLQGVGGLQGDHPLNADGVFPLAGISRDDFITNYVQLSAPKASKMWADDLHSKSHHQQGPDFLKSSHYRNSKELLTCATCHDLHGGTGYDRAMIDDPQAPESALCMDCHGATMESTFAHTEQMVGYGHGAAIANCVDCHMVKTAKTGSGDYGLLLDIPDGSSGDADITYFENDITSHVFDVPYKTNVGVSGVTPASAMPIPYTQSCGTCHDASMLQY